MSAVQMPRGPERGKFNTAM